jgi:FAD:protein FMN transferase
MGPTVDSIRRARPLLGTFVDIFACGRERAKLECAVDDAFQAVEKVHRLMSFHERDSDVSRLNREAHTKPIKVDPWTFRVLEVSLALYGQSKGVFDISIAPTLQRLGLLPGAPQKRDAVATWHDWRARESGLGIGLIADEKVRFHRGDVKIDLGGIAKGFAVDRAIDVLQHHGIPTGLVNAGGDLYALGIAPHTIHIRNPWKPGELLCEIQICNEALASSGRTFDPLFSCTPGASAIIDPQLRKPVASSRGVTVRAPSCVIADALTKVVLIQGETAIPVLNHYNASALFVLSDGGVRCSPGWKGLSNIAA